MDSLHNMPKTSPQNKLQLNIAIVGLGRMGNRHAKTLLYRCPYTNLVGVCSNDEKELKWAREFFSSTNGQKEGNETKVFDDYSRMLSLPGLQAVWVSSSTDAHYWMSRAGIEKGLHILCEKPLSQNLDEAYQLLALAKANPHLKVMAGFSRRFDASYRDAKAKISQGTIGSPFLVRSQTCDLLDTTGFFVRYAAKNGGIFVDCAIHDIDLSLWYMGQDIKPKRCWAMGSIAHHPELESLQDVDNGVGCCEFWDGQMAYFYCSRTMAHGHDVATEIIGTKGKIMVNIHPRANNVLVASSSGIGNEVQPEYWERFEDAFATEANEFCECVLEDKPVPLPLDFGVKVMEIGRALQDALLTGEQVLFDQEGKRLPVVNGVGKSLE